MSSARGDVAHGINGNARLFYRFVVDFFVIGVPVSISIGLTCMAVLWAENDLLSIPLTLFPLKMMHGINSFPLLATPFFILAATVMNTGSVTSRIFNFANALVGHLRGGLGHVNVVASMIFAGMSGTAVADAAGLGALEIKAMKEQGYPLSYSIGITGASSVPLTVIVTTCEVVSPSAVVAVTVKVSVNTSVPLKP